MKTKLLLALGAVIAILNFAIFFCPAESARPVASGISLVLGLAVVLVALLPDPPAKTAPASEEKQSQSPPVPVAPPPGPEIPAIPAGAEALTLLSLLQEHGRLVDFAMEDISRASDSELGAAARVVHAGCSKVLRESFSPEPVRTEAEGTPITLESGYDAQSHRLIGSVPQNPPYTGRLVHPGWRAKSIQLPRPTIKGMDTPESRIISPAEIEVRG